MLTGVLHPMLASARGCTQVNFLRNVTSMLSAAINREQDPSPGFSAHLRD